jgi:F-type H+-transporting ATPase subunit b
VHLVTLTVSGDGHPQVVVLAPAQVVPAQATTEEELDEGPSPIAPELKELAWGAGAFVVLAILVRLFLFPRLKQGMDARHELIRGELESAEATRAAAEAELTEYNAELARVRVDANARIDAVRQTLEAERQAKLTEVNATVAERRAAAMAEAEATKDAAREQMAAAASQIVALAGERVLSRPVDPDAARAAVEAALSAGVR